MDEEVGRSLHIPSDEISPLPSLSPVVGVPGFSHCRAAGSATKGLTHLVVRVEDGLDARDGRRRLGDRLRALARHEDIDLHATRRERVRSGARFGGRVGGEVRERRLRARGRTLPPTFLAAEIAASVAAPSFELSCSATTWRRTGASGEWVGAARRRAMGCGGRWRARGRQRRRGRRAPSAHSGATAARMVPSICHLAHARGRRRSGHWPRSAGRRARAARRASNREATKVGHFQRARRRRRGESAHRGRGVLSAWCLPQCCSAPRSRSGCTGTPWRPGSCGTIERRWCATRTCDPASPGRAFGSTTTGAKTSHSSA